MSQESGSTVRNRSIGPLGGLLALAAIYAVLVLPMTLLESRRADIPAQPRSGYPSEVMDQDNYHWLVIREMALTWPRADVVTYDSATTPGYHWLQAGVLRITGSRAGVLLANAAIGFALAAALWWSLAGVPGVGPWLATAMTLPLVTSPYVLGGSIWLTTDNLALLFVTLVLGGCVLRPFTPGRGLRLGLYQTGAVLVRQIHVWPIALIGLAGLLASPLARLVPSPPLGALRARLPEGERRWANLVAAIAACALPVAVLGAFVWMWGGLVPRAENDLIREFHTQGPNPAAFGLALAVTGVYALFFLGTLWDEVRRLRPSDWRLWAAGLAGLAVGAAFETSFQPKARAYGWVWSVVQKGDALLDRLPALAALERSPVIIAGAALGAVMILPLYRAAKTRGNAAPALMLLLGLLGWVCAQSVNSMAWQRYFDPIVLIGLAMIAALGAGRGPARLRWAGPIALAGAQLLLAIATMYREYLGTVM